jgi:hypothetical protein
MAEAVDGKTFLSDPAGSFSQRRIFVASSNFMASTSSKERGE